MTHFLRPEKANDFAALSESPKILRSSHLSLGVEADTPTQIDLERRRFVFSNHRWSQSRERFRRQNEKPETVSVVVRSKPPNPSFKLASRRLLNLVGTCRRDRSKNPSAAHPLQRRPQIAKLVGKTSLLCV